MAKQNDIILKLMVEGGQAFAVLDNGEKKLLNLERSADRTNLNMKNMLSSLSLVFGGAATLRFFKESVDAYAAAEAALKKIEAAVESTGGAAGLTTDELSKMAAALQKITTFDDDDILANVTAQLLTFVNITGDNFKRAQMAILDVATVLAGDKQINLKETALQVGKALNDPIKGITALSRTGIQFTDQQREMIRQLVESNRMFEAQKIILDELSKQFGGQAQAAANTFSGRIVQLRNRVGDLQEELGKNLVPAIDVVVDKVSAFVTRVENAGGVFKGFAVASKIVGSGLIVILTALQHIGSLIGTVGAGLFSLFTGDYTGAANIYVMGFNNIIDNVKAGFSSIIDIWNTAEKKIGEGSQNIAGSLNKSTGGRIENAGNKVNNLIKSSSALLKDLEAIDAKLKDININERDRNELLKKRLQITNQLRLSSEELKIIQDQLRLDIGMADMMNGPLQNQDVVLPNVNIKPQASQLTTQRLQELQQEAELINELKEMYSEFGHTISDAFANGIAMGRSFNEILKQIYQSLLAAFLRAVLFKSAMSIFGDFSGGAAAASIASPSLPGLGKTSLSLLSDPGSGVPAVMQKLERNAALSRPVEVKIKLEGSELTGDGMSLRSVIKSVEEHIAVNL